MVKLCSFSKQHWLVWERTEHVCLLVGEDTGCLQLLRPADWEHSCMPPSNFPQLLETGEHSQAAKTPLLGCWAQGNMPTLTTLPSSLATGMSAEVSQWRHPCLAISCSLAVLPGATPSLRGHRNPIHLPRDPPCTPQAGTAPESLTRLQGMAKHSFSPSSPFIVTYCADSVL